MDAAIGIARPADRLSDVRPSAIRAIFDRAVQIEKAGNAVIHFEIGRPDFDAPEVIEDATAKALADGLVITDPTRTCPSSVPQSREPDPEALATTTLPRYSRTSRKTRTSARKKPSGRSPQSMRLKPKKTPSRQPAALPTGSRPTYSRKTLPVHSAWPKRLMRA